MAAYDVLRIERNVGDAEWEPYLRLHIMQANRTRTREYLEAAQELTGAHITFRVRWCRPLAAVEFDTSSFRAVWHGRVFDIRGYDDFMQSHRDVSLECVSYGEEERCPTSTTAPLTA